MKLCGQLLISKVLIANHLQLSIKILMQQVNITFLFNLQLVWPVLVTVDHSFVFALSTEISLSAAGLIWTCYLFEPNSAFDFEQFNLNSAISFSLK